MHDFNTPSKRLKKDNIKEAWNIIYVICAIVVAYTAITRISNRTALELCKTFNEGDTEAIINCYFDR